MQETFKKAVGRAKDWLDKQSNKNDSVPIARKKSFLINGFALATGAAFLFVLSDTSPVPELVSENVISPLAKGLKEVLGLSHP